MITLTLAATNVVAILTGATGGIGYPGYSSY